MDMQKYQVREELLHKEALRLPDWAKAEKLDLLPQQSVWDMLESSAKEEKHSIRECALRLWAKLTSRRNMPAVCVKHAAAHC